MRYIHFVLLLSTLLAFQISAKGFNYQAVPRLTNGKAISNAEVRLKISIIPSLDSENTLYTEDHFTFTDSNGLINIIIGDGVPSHGDWNNINWSNQYYLKAVAIVDGKEQIVSVSSIMGAPKAIGAMRTNKLVSKSSDGTAWELKVNNVGDLKWDKIAPGRVDYPKERWPAELYLVGSFSDWDIDNAKKFNKVGEGKFATQCNLSTGDVIKFTKVRSWDGDVDWSGTSGKLNVKEPLREWGNTPRFEGETNTYMIFVDFNTFTLRIYLL